MCEIKTFQTCLHFDVSSPKCTTEGEKYVIPFHPSVEYVHDIQIAAQIRNFIRDHAYQILNTHEKLHRFGGFCLFFVFFPLSFVHTSLIVPEDFIYN